MRNCNGFFVYLTNSKSKIMEAKELRIGNYVLSECLDSAGYFEETIITGVFDDEIHHESIGMTKPIWENKIEKIKPIPLNKENLLRLGFEFPTSGTLEIYLNGKDDCSIIFEYEENKGLVYTAGLGYKLSCYITQVHEVQNFVYELERIELNFKRLI